MPAVVATVGFGGHNMADKFLRILQAQMAVGDPKKHPEFAGTVASVDTTAYWRDSSVSPSTAGYHYNHNAETYLLVGDALGRAMADRLLDAVRRLGVGVGDQTVRMTISIGLAEFDPGEDATAWIDRADKALYEAKAQGRNTIVAADKPRRPEGGFLRGRG